MILGSPKVQHTLGKTHPSPGVAPELGLVFPASLGADCRGREVLSVGKPPSAWLVGGTRSRPFLPELEQGREWLYRPGGEKDLAPVSSLEPPANSHAFPHSCLTCDSP